MRILGDVIRASFTNRRPLCSWLSQAGQIAAWAITAVLGLAIVVTVLIPRLIGAESFTVVSGSMEPAIPTGSIVVSRPIAVEDVRFNDVITFQMESGKSQTVTHRVIGVDFADGQQQFRTQGDANSVEDPVPVLPVQVRGKVLYHVPLVGYMSTWISPAAREGLATAVGVGLLIYAAVLVVRIVLTRGKKNAELG